MLVSIRQYSYVYIVKSHGSPVTCRLKIWLCLHIVYILNFVYILTSFVNLLWLDHWAFVFQILGADITVVDSNNKTVIDLLAAHPSAKTREIESLIYGEFCCTVGRCSDIMVSALYSVSTGPCFSPCCWDHCVMS